MTLRERDKKHLWHPLTQHKLHPDHIAITKAKGAVLYDDKGNEYIDGIASWYTCMYGHCNPYITNKVAKQMEQLDHVVFAGFTHEPAIKLSEELIKILPDNQEKIFFSDNGSTSVDVSIKMALQYHFNNGDKRNKVIALEGGFHGDTFGAMSVSGLSVYNGPFEDFFIDVERIPVPDANNFNEVKKQFEKILTDHKVAAFIFEPLVQGAAAMKMHEAAFIDELLAIAKNKGVVTIADEVMTGFGKTGKNFASEYLQNLPDIICLSKSLTAGLVPMAITSCSQQIYNAFLSDELGKGFFHGHTYSANPTACAAALAGVELLQSDEIQTRIERVIKSHRTFEEKIKNHPKVKETRQLGVIFALDLNLEMERYGNLRYQLFNFFMENGVCLRPLGSTIYILAPFVITDEQLHKIYTTIEKALDTF
ncbi:adenosylmethionine-8-amino-7-oxononanoate aminotransferase [Tenacibaculum sp. MAR_2009_124]|uniref:adenosylmethionine--8-amino-7-oxononanoate transaminase n=1 Tax=Tenacibaculum sp. MAR_2009_124 TaxID=1250059 RepID=UPI00089BB7A9|nr:adenosylmethionine--8-amino-7-oxononanoate transaminase [Tenacibaculum sp. MAR_2009_124]SEC27380.1 adenosylmethionine-8-amino-7-oxononanoate aminotransferase [Tenacibaculum sp. MAR_2009_124]